VEQVETVIAKQWHIKHVFAAIDTDATAVEELQEAVKNAIFCDVISCGSCWN
jgi:hypothetical protein